MGLDIGPATVELLSTEIARARTIIWNGPMGVFEMPAFANGTNGVAEALAENAAAITIVGGGDSVSADQTGRGGRQDQAHFYRRRRVA